MRETSNSLKRPEFVSSIILKAKSTLSSQGAATKVPMITINCFTVIVVAFLEKILNALSDESLSGALRSSINPE
jgi:hypothetical protein